MRFTSFLSFAVVFLALNQTVASNPGEQPEIELGKITLEPGSTYNLTEMANSNTQFTEQLYWMSANQAVGIIDYYGRSPWKNSVFVAVNEGSTIARGYNANGKLEDSLLVVVKHRKGSFAIEAENCEIIHGDLEVSQNNTREYLTTNSYVATGLTEYEFKVSESGIYEMVYNYSINGGTFNISVNNNSYTHNIPFRNNIYNPLTYVNYNAGYIKLEKGINTLILSFTEHNYGMYPCYIDYFIFRPADVHESEILPAEMFADDIIRW